MVSLSRLAGRPFSAITACTHCTVDREKYGGIFWQLNIDLVSETPLHLHSRRSFSLQWIFSIWSDYVGCITFIKKIEIVIWNVDSTTQAIFECLYRRKLNLQQLMGLVQYQLSWSPAFLTFWWYYYIVRTKWPITT